jgi:hypothetical protein
VKVSTVYVSSKFELCRAFFVQCMLLNCSLFSLLPLTKDGGLREGRVEDFKQRRHLCIDSYNCPFYAERRVEEYVAVNMPSVFNNRTRGTGLTELEVNNRFSNLLRFNTQQFLAALCKITLRVTSNFFG